MPSIGGYSQTARSRLIDITVNMWVCMSFVGGGGVDRLSGGGVFGNILKDTLCSCEAYGM